MSGLAGALPFQYRSPRAVFSICLVHVSPVFVSVSECRQVPSSVLVSGHVKCRRVLHSVLVW